MDFTVTIFRRDRTDMAPKTFYLSRWRLIGYFLLLVGLPVFGFWLSYSVVAPRMLNTDVAELRFTAQESSESAELLEARQEALVEENETLRIDLQNEKGLRAELEAKLAIAETARAEGSTKLAGLEGEVIDLRQKIVFFEQLTKPANEQAPLQCFNIDATLKDKTLTYAFTLMKNDGKNKAPMDVKVVLRAMVGAKALDMAKAEVEKMAPLQTKNTRLTFDSTIKGSVTLKDIPDGLRLLDIRAYQGDKTVAHCWKAF
ncbi:MAG: hypothetical protein WAX89_00825 [Alphaproteobacteria bacterium]